MHAACLCDQVMPAASVYELLLLLCPTGLMSQPTFSIVPVLGTWQVVLLLLLLYTYLVLVAYDFEIANIYWCRVLEHQGCLPVLC